MFFRVTRIGLMKYIMAIAVGAALVLLGQPAFAGEKEDVEDEA